MFIRTESGIRNTDLFHPKEYIVYVEGDDDVLFWQMFFPEEVLGYKRKLKKVGGSLKNYIDEIYKANANFAVALDSDYNLFMKKLHNHTQILETTFHSIENILINSKSLADIIRASADSEKFNIEEIEKWISYFDDNMYDLMIADYLLKKKVVEEKVSGDKGLGNSCLQFSDNQKIKSPLFDTNTISNFIKELNLNSEDFIYAQKLFREYKPSQHIKGHFFFSASLCFVNYQINLLNPKKNKKKRRSISNDDFYVMLRLSCKNSLRDCSDLQEICEKAVKAAEKVVQLLSSR